MILKYNKTCIILGLCWILFEQCFYLMPSTIAGIYLQDIAIIILLFYILVSSLRYGILIDTRNDKFSFLSISFEAIILIAAVVAYFHWGQDFLTSVLPERYLVVILFSYLTIKMSLGQGDVTSVQLLNMLLFLGKIELTIMIIQFFAQFAGVYFLYADYNNSIYTYARFAVDGTTVLLVVFYEISNLFSEESRKIHSLVWVFMGAIFFFLMVQTRMTLIGICIAVVIYYLTLNTTIQRKMVMTVVLVCVAILIYNTSLFQDTINIQESGSRNTMDIRISAMSFYVDELSDSPLFGAGAYPSSSIANIDRGRDSGYNLNDNGLFGFAYMYGLIGLIWAVYMYCHLVSKSYKYYKNEGQSVFLFSPSTL